MHPNPLNKVRSYMWSNASKKVKDCPKVILETFMLSPSVGVCWCASDNMSKSSSIVRNVVCPRFHIFCTFMTVSTFLHHGWLKYYSNQARTEWRGLRKRKHAHCILYRKDLNVKPCLPKLVSHDHVKWYFFLIFHFSNFWVLAHFILIAVSPHVYYMWQNSGGLVPIWHEIDIQFLPVGGLAIFFLSLLTGILLLLFLLTRTKTSTIFLLLLIYSKPMHFSQPSLLPWLSFLSSLCLLIMCVW